MKQQKNILSAATAIVLAAFSLAACKDAAPTADATGIFEATEVVVSAKSQGEILSLTANEGDDVKAGDVLATIDVRQLTLQKEQLTQTRQSTDSRRVDVALQVASLRQQQANLESERARFADLVEAGAATQKQVDDLDHQISIVKHQIKALSDQLTSANTSISEQSEALGTQVSQVEALIDDATVTSPLAGTVLERYSEPGEYAAPGRPLYKIANLATMTLRAYVTAEQYNTLRLGQKVSVSVDGQEKTYAGTVAWISPKAEFTPKTIQTKDERSNLVYAVKIRVQNDGVLKIGMYGEVNFN